MSTSVFKAIKRDMQTHTRLYVILVCTSFIVALLALNMDVSFDMSDGSMYSRELQEGAEEPEQYHKDLFPLDRSDYIGTTLVVIGLMIAASGGIGGGGLLVPIFIIIFEFKALHAVALSNFTILGSSMMNMALNLPKRHPTVDRPLVDWDLIVIMEPVTMAGAILGAYVGKVLPEVFLVISLVCLLGYTSKITIDKGLQLWNKETKAALEKSKSELAKAVEMKEQESDDAESSSLLGRNTVESDIDANNQETGSVPAPPPPLTEDERALEELLETERSTPVTPVIWMNTMFIVVVALTMLKGGSGGRALPSPVGIECGSASYWALTGVIFAFILTVSYYMRELLVDKWRLKKRLNYKYAAGDIEWNEYNTLKYPAMCVFAGLCAGMFGIGGGIVKGPLMLQMNVNPLVASATVAVMIFFTSIAATASYMAFGILIWDYGWFLFVLGLAATLIGQYGVGYLVKKYNRVSLVSLSIGAVVCISTCLMAFQSVYSLLSADAENNEKTSSICG